MRITKNTVVFVIVAALAGTAIGLTQFGGDESEGDLVVLSFGGEFSKAQRSAYFAPYEETYGVSVVDTSYGGEYGKIKAAVDSGAVPWDVVDVESSALLRGVDDGVFQRLDLTAIQTNDLDPRAVHEYAVGTDFYSVSLGINTDAFPDGKRQPQAWSDFWDVESFPGPRCLKKDPRFTLEIALMADGVALDEIYEGGLDVGRAFASLDRIKDHVAVWWTTGQQPIDLLSSGEVVMAAAFGARIYNAQHRDNQPVSLTWNNGILDIEYWAVPVVAKKINESLNFIEFASGAKPQAAFAAQIPLGPVNRKAFEHLEVAFAESLNTHPDNIDTQLLFDAQFWASNEEQLRERFNTWLVDD